MAPIPEPITSEEPEIPIPSPLDEEAWEDYQDYCASAEALEEALQTKEITPLDEYIKELGLEKECGI
jgi:hypothetical protein